MRLRKVHFVIHNQGPYDLTKKDKFLALIKQKYGDNLEAYLICQEMYSHQPDDSHLQGNLFFKNAIHHTAIIKVIKTVYKEQQTAQGLLGRCDISPVLHEGRAYNYMINSSKDGGDRYPISDMTALDCRKQEQAFKKELAELLCSTALLCDRKKWDTRVWEEDRPYTDDELTYKKPNWKPSDFYHKLNIN